MPGIVGDFESVSSTLPPLDAHVAHLRHLTNQRVAREFLEQRHRVPGRELRATTKLWAAHIHQALEFHMESRSAPMTIRPVLQYYCYLNLAVATILAKRPPNANQYRQHGVEDKTHAVSQLDLSSVLLRVKKKGAVPLFHSLLSDVSLEDRRLRFGQVIAGFHMCGHELVEAFNKEVQTFAVQESVAEEAGQWYSVFKFSELRGDQAVRVRQPGKLERAMPLLVSNYSRDVADPTHTQYRSTNSWGTESAALRIHRQNGMKLANYGGHSVISTPGSAQPVYAWRGVSRRPLMPTLSSTLLMAFSLASICRYRPMLLRSAMQSSIALLINTFVNEADAVFIPSLRNMLYCEELTISSVEYI